MPNSLKAKIIEILRSFFVDGGKDKQGNETWGVPERADQILSLFEVERIKWRKEIFPLYKWNDGKLKRIKKSGE